MGRFLQNTGRFFKNNSSTILTCVGAIGVVATAITAAKATPKAMELVKKVEEEKGEELNKFEKVKTAAPAYIPTIAIGASTIGCIFGANILNKRSQASIASLYMFLDNSYKQYKKKVEELYGEDANSRIYKSIAEDKYENYNPVAIVRDDVRTYFDVYSMQYFEATEIEVRSAEKRINQIYKRDGIVSLNEYYELLGLPITDAGYEVGWSEAAAGAWWGYEEILFDYDMITLEDGMEIWMISMPFEPTFDYKRY